MDIKAFRKAFWHRFNGPERNRPSYAYENPYVATRFDLCPGVNGMISIKKQQLLNLAFGFLDESECYLEVGTYQGKSLLSAILSNPSRPVFACDNFSEFDENSLQITRANLERFGLVDRVTLYDCDFLGVFEPERLPVPIGLYHYDAAHDEESQYRAIKLVEPFMADEALVIIDDWNGPPLSGSYAKAGTMRAVNESVHRWQLLYELPARFNGDVAMWWNGVGVLAFRRESNQIASAQPFSAYI